MDKSQRYLDIETKAIQIQHVSKVHLEKIQKIRFQVNPAYSVFVYIFTLLAFTNFISDINKSRQYNYYMLRSNM